MQVAGRREEVRENKEGMKEIKTNMEKEAWIQQATDLHGNTAITAECLHLCVCVCVLPPRNFSITWELLCEVWFHIENKPLLFKAGSFYLNLTE